MFTCCRKPVKIFHRSQPLPGGGLPFPVVSPCDTSQTYSLTLRQSEFWMNYGFEGLLQSRAQSSQRVGRWDLKPICPFQELHQKSRNFPRYRKIHGWIKMVSEWNGIDFYSLQTLKPPVEGNSIASYIAQRKKEHIFLEIGDDFVHCRFLRAHRLR